MFRELLALPKLYLLLHVVNLASQPLDHPVHLGNLLFGISEIIAMSARCDLQLLILKESEKSQSSRQMPGLDTVCVPSLALRATAGPSVH